MQFSSGRLGFQARSSATEMPYDAATNQHELMASAPEGRVMSNNGIVALSNRASALRYCVQFVSVLGAWGCVVGVTGVKSIGVDVAVGGRVKVLLAGTSTGESGMTQYEYPSHRLVQLASTSGLRTRNWEKVTLPPVDRMV